MPVRRLVVVALAALAFAVPAIAVPMVAGAATSDPTKRIGELQTQIGEASKAELDALKEVEAVRAQRTKLDAAVRALEAQVVAANAKVAEADAEIERVASRYLALEAQITDADAKLTAAKAALTATAVERYRRADSGSTVLTLIRSINEPGDLVSGQRYLRDITAEQSRDVTLVADLRADLAAARDQLADEKAKAESARAEAAKQREVVAKLQGDQAKARQAAAAEEAKEQSVLAAIRARKDEFTRELTALQASSSSLTQLLRNVQAGQTPSGRGPFKVPVSAPITSSFGPRVHPIFGDARIHAGIDFGASQGTPIKAAGAGTVVFAGVMSGYGNVVLIDHGGAVATLYAHQSRLASAVGRRVNTGDVIGYVGSTGYATGPHLHFEVRIQGVPVNPMSYL